MNDDLVIVALLSFILAFGCGWFICCIRMADVISAKDRKIEFQQEEMIRLHQYNASLWRQIREREDPDWWQKGERPYGDCS